MKALFDKLNNELKTKFKKCRLVILDFDGILTDDIVIHDQNGIEAVARSRGDSMGIDLLADAGLYDKKKYKNNSKEVDIVIVTREINIVVASVAKKISIKCTQSQYEKPAAFDEEVKNHGLDYSEVLYMGNDLNDLECLKKAGLKIAVADSHPEILEIADYVTVARGGRGAFREICEMILHAKGVHPYP